jgi:hypothetical protein
MDRSTIRGGGNLILAIATMVAEKYAPSRVRAGALPSSHFDAKPRKY